MGLSTLMSVTSFSRRSWAREWAGQRWMAISKNIPCARHSAVASGYQVP